MNFSWIKSQRDVAMFVCAGTAIALAATHMIAFVVLGPAMLFQILDDDYLPDRDCAADVVHCRGRHAGGNIDADQA